MAEVMKKLVNIMAVEQRKVSKTDEVRTCYWNGNVWLFFLIPIKQASNIYMCITYKLVYTTL